MLAKIRANREQAALKSDLQPPRTGPNADPILYGVAAALATLFPPVSAHGQNAAETGTPRQFETGREAPGSL
ncbi:hypothetical protein ACRAWG_04085 [Methylobacterium sp. P31]